MLFDNVVYETCGLFAGIFRWSIKSLPQRLVQFNFKSFASLGTIFETNESGKEFDRNACPFS
jgi:hypothetical protein